MTTSPHTAKREILARVRRGELDPQEAAALLRRAHGEARGFGPGAAGPHNTVWYDAVWTAAPPAPRPTPHSGASMLVLSPDAAEGPDEAGRYVVPTGALVDWSRVWSALNGARSADVRVVLDARRAPGTAVLGAAFALLKAVIEDRSQESVALAVLTAGSTHAGTADALGALCRTAALEDRRVRAVSVHVMDAASRDARALAQAELSSPVPGSAQVRYDRAGRAVRTLIPLLPVDEGGARPWRERGVYLITGGAGGIGAHLAEHLAERYQARLVLLGRSAPTRAVHELLARVGEKGGEAVYIQADVTDRGDMARAVARARDEFGPLTGVLHAAGVNEDSYLVNKDLQEVHRVLAPKLTGTDVLDEVTAAEPLELFVLLSSVASYIGGPGQSDYAAANRALGALAALRSEAVIEGTRSGATVSVALPLIAGGGMDLDERDKRAVRDLHGMAALPVGSLLDTLGTAVASGRTEVFVMHGDMERIRASVEQGLAVQPPTESTALPTHGVQPGDGSGGVTGQDIGPAAQEYLLALVSDVIRLPAGKLRPDQELSTVGVDSVLIKKITVRLEDRLGPLPATLLFEYRTVAELSRYLAAEHTEALRQLFVAPAASQLAERTGEREPGPASAPDHTAGGGPGHPDEPIAVIGVAGRYPGGRDLDEYWQTLRDGRDAITEVPADRWDHTRYYAPGERTGGRTYGKWGGFIENADRFDALFFNMSPRDAERADPTERVFLEVAWSALENAGYSRRLLHERTRRGDEHALGVFVGVTATSYKLIGAEEWGKNNPVTALSMDFSVANRLSYLLDAHGPSLVVDTACSSSLTAFHLAVESLRRGECAMAITGGAHIQTHPIKYGVLADMRLLSTDGRCRAFGAGGDGFVPSEGAGALVLKPLSAALADGDHVHGVIRGTHVNHGGRTNGYTVPSPRAHANVVSAALDRAEVGADTVGYVEAHGTGTALGDPIEVEGLRRAFARHTDRTGYCAIGSAKSNIGHAESAAGVAGVTKVLLQFAHGELVPSLHATEVNPKIDFSRSPFVLQRELGPWRRIDADTPRRAAVSSFGAGGSNGHVILEEPPLTPLPESVAEDGTEQLIVLSAKTDERLRAVARRLCDHLGARPGTRLTDVALTLATGREELESRLAVTARTVTELRDRLGTFVDTGSADGLCTGHADLMASESVSQERIRELCAACDWRALAVLWSEGAVVDWAGAFPGAKRLPLPTYPFAGDRHWVATTPPLDADSAAPHAHGPLGRVVPSLEGLVYETEFIPDAPVVADHVVTGRALLAGVVQLQIAVAAAEGLDRGRVREITDVRWRTPVEITGTGTTVRTALSAGDSGLDYTIGTGAGAAAHSTGTAHVTTDPATPPAALDLDALRARCTNHHDGGDFYTTAERGGLAYGPLFRRLFHVRSAVGGQEALGELTPPPATGAPEWAVDAGALDGALHALHGVLPPASPGEQPLLPASVARVELHGRLSAARHVHVRLREYAPERGIARADATLTDEHGVPVAAFHDLRVARPATGAGAEVRHLRTAWQVLDAPAAPAGHGGGTLILTTGRDFGLGQALTTRYDGARLLRLDLPEAERRVAEAVRDLPADSLIHFLGGVDDRLYSAHDLAHLDTSLDQGCLALFHLAKLLVGRRPDGLRLSVVTSDSQQVDEGVSARNPYAAALVGLAKSLARELPFAAVSCLDLDRHALARGGSELSRLATAVHAEPPAFPVQEVALRGAVRLGRTLRALTLAEPDEERLPFTRGGTYLLVGGAGGLGRAVARHLADQYAARLVLVGRRPLEELPETLLSELRASGGEAVYEQTDITDRAATDALIARVRERFGPVNGAIHAAFTLADGLLAGMDETTFRRTLHAKTHGTVVLAEALAGEPLDFLALFSSAVSHRANAGQANYSAASTFQDAYAHYLSTRTRQPVKLFNWGLWGDSGSVATEDYRRRVARLGVAGLTDDEGILALRRVMGAPLVQATVIKTTGGQELEGVTDAGPDILDVPGDGRAVRAAARGAAEIQDASSVPPGYLDRLDDLARREVLTALRDMGLPVTAADARTPDQLAADLDVVRQQRRFLDALLDMVRGAGLADEDDGRLSFPVAPYEGTDSATTRARLVDDHPFCAATVELITDCAAALPDVLTGRRRGLEVLFPSGSQDRLAPLYHGDPRAQHFNAMCTAAVVRRVSELRRDDPDRDITVLEIGSGTGGTTSPLLMALKECDGPAPGYVCTDISPTLVRQAAERFGSAHPEAVFRTLDIAADPAPQGFADRRYDIVVAANVLHATSDLRTTLHNVAGLMSPGALLAINESTAVLDAVTLVFGLTEGWWLYGDGHLRLPHSPLLGAEDWGAVLAAAGLRDVTALAATEGDDAHADQSLLLAERGNVRPHGAGSAPGVVTAALPEARPEPVPEAMDAAAPTDVGEGGRPWLVGRLRTFFAASLKLAEAELNDCAPLLTYGVDSLVVMDVTDSLERDLGWRPSFDEALDGKTLVEVADLLLRKGVPLPEEAKTTTGAPDAAPLHPAEGPTHPAHVPVVTPETPTATRSNPPRTSSDVPIAVIGIAGRYPGADDLATFWDNLSGGRCAVGEIPVDRWPATEQDDRRGERRGAFLHDVDRFDSLLFRISPREAQTMDPQERLLLETAWTALEDAGATCARLEADAVRVTETGVGVFAGAMHTPYQSLVADRWGRGQRPRGSSGGWALANRVSHCFGFSGPSIAVDSACSSSLTALHLACESLRRDECGAAVVGGVNLILHPSHHADLAAARMLSAEGRARAFDVAGDGMVTGEGVGAVVLKPLPEALRAGDRVHAVITGSSVNHNAGDSTYTTPDADAQVALLLAVLRRAGIGPDDVQYVEAAATGSPLGDPVEAEALRRVFAGRPTDRGPVRVGSLKPNVGHLEAASGMAQLAKVLLQLKAGQIVPTIGVTTSLPAFSEDGSPLELVTAPTTWPGGAGRAVRCAAVSSFGAGGANAQLIVAAPPEQPEQAPVEGPQLVPLSARRPQELRQLAGRLRDFLRGPGNDVTLADVAHTLRVGRAPLRERAAFVVHDLPGLVDRLDELAGGAPLAEPDLGALQQPWAEAAARWGAGGDVDWREHGSTGRVTSLPGYPFARERHWFPESAAACVEETSMAATGAPATVAGATPQDREAVHEAVVSAIGAVLGLPAEEIGSDDHLSDFGFDSITLTELAAVLSDELAVGVLPPELYAHTDVASLVDALAARRPVPAETVGIPQVHSPRAAADEPIAVVGMAGRFPGSPDLDAYWENLVAGRDLVTEIPDERFDWREIYGDPRQDPERVPSRWGGFLGGIDRFDPEFFRISPREARTMDPQHRLFLETVWQAVEDAGHDPASLEGSRTGVFVGVGSSEYAQLLISRGVEVDGQAATGNAHSVLANRVSFLLGLHGPSEPVDTACSSSLTAVHRAVQAIRAGECDAALAGGVNVILSPTGFLAFGKSGMLSPDGRCKTFDHRADGYVRGEGVAAVLLKPLSRALADGDHVHALIRGTAVNHGGRANSLTAPNPQAQTDVIVRAHRAAGVSADTITYIEAHGTGTALGDPIEVNGLVDAFRELGGEGRTGYCALGSVKTNVGHLETAAGVAGLIKVVKALQHRQLPPSLHLERVNPLIDLADTPFRLLAETTEWQRLPDGRGGDVPLRAGISSFGFGGVNAHVVVEEYEPEDRACVEEGADPHLFVLSARTDERLRRYAAVLADDLEHCAHRSADVAHTLRVGRPALDERLAVFAHTLPDLVESLRAYADGSGMREPEGVGPLRQLAVRWVRRKQTDWSELGALPGRRVPLPTYPFATDRYWLPEPLSPARAEPAPAPAPVPQRQSTDTGKETAQMEQLEQRDRQERAAANSSELTRQVRELVALGVGLTPEEIDPSKDFAAYGIDSIVALRIMQRLQAKYGDGIPMAAIFEYPSLDRLVEHIAELGPSLAAAAATPAVPAAAPEPAGQDSAPEQGLGAVSAVVAARPEEPQGTQPQQSAPLLARVVPFVPDAQGIPVYCLPGDTGELSWLTHLQTALADDGPVLGVEPPGFRTGQAPLTSVADLAEAATDAIVADRLQGPYRVAGQGTGGILALEVARRLLDLGHQVEELLLVGAPEPGARAPRGLGALTGALGTVWGAYRRLDGDAPGDGTTAADFTDAAQALIAHAHPPIPESALAAWLREAHAHRSALTDAVSAHAPRPLSGPARVTVVRALVQGEPATGDWQRWFAQTTRTIALPSRPDYLTSAGAAVDLRRLHRSRAEQPQPERQFITSVNQAGDKQRAYWMHHMYGDVSYSLYLSRFLGPDYPVMGVEQVDVDSNLHRFDTFQEMCGQYAAAIRADHPGGPITLAGSSFGGVVAYEVARQLLHQGERIRSLVVADGIMPTTPAWAGVDWSSLTDEESESLPLMMLGNSYCHRWNITELIGLETLFGKKEDEQLRLIARHVVDKAAAKLSYDQILMLLRRTNEAFNQNVRLLTEYVPQPLPEPVDVTFFHATQGFVGEGNPARLPAMRRLGDDRTNGFGRFVGKPLRVHDVDADHFTIVHDQGLRTMARLMTPALGGPEAPEPGDLI